MLTEHDVMLNGVEACSVAAKEHSRVYVQRIINSPRSRSFPKLHSVRNIFSSKQVCQFLDLLWIERAVWIPDTSEHGAEGMLFFQQPAVCSEVGIMTVLKGN